MRSFAWSSVAVVLMMGSTTHGAVLCAKPRRDGSFNTAVRIREACKPTEVILSPTALGFCCSLPPTTTVLRSAEMRRIRPFPSPFAKRAFTSPICRANGSPGAGDAGDERPDAPVREARG
jgi:hypothetical protein